MGKIIKIDIGDVDPSTPIGEVINQGVKNSNPPDEVLNKAFKETSKAASEYLEALFDISQKYNISPVRVTVASLCTIVASFDNIIPMKSMLIKALSNFDKKEDK